MKRNFLLFCMTVFFVSASYAQITKGNWLVGGSGSLRSTNTTNSSPNTSTSSKRLDITISPSIGNFIMDKFALGLKAGYNKYKEEGSGSNGLSTNTNRYSFGPFARYYFLEKEKHYNILLESSYQFGIYSFGATKGNSSLFNTSIGPVIYFNSSIGLEFLFGYYNFKETIRQSGDFVSKQNGIQMSLGLQVHLDK